MKVKTRYFSADTVIRAEKRIPLTGGLPFGQYSFLPKMRNASEMSGAGLYACFYRDELIYIGKYLGQKKKWGAGDVVPMRWIKHLGTFTMQARSIGFSKRALQDILNAIRQKEEVDVPEMISQGFLAANALVLERSAGCVSTFQRFKVALRVWKDAGNQPHLNLNDFGFLYTRVEGEGDTSQIRQLVSAAEMSALDTIHPPGNTIAGRRQTHLPEASELTEIFESILKDEASLNATATASPRHQANENAGDERSEPRVSTRRSEPPNARPFNLRGDQEMLVEPEEIESLFEQNLEDAPEFARSFVANLAGWLSKIPDADLEFTNKPDMRVRKIYPHTKRGFRNCVTFEWQPQLERFIFCSKLSVHDLAQFGLNVAGVRKSGPLPNKVFLTKDMLETRLDDITGAVSEAHSKYQI